MDRISSSVSRSSASSASASSSTSSCWSSGWSDRMVGSTAGRTGKHRSRSSSCCNVTTHNIGESESSAAEDSTDSCYLSIFVMRSYATAWLSNRRCVHVTRPQSAIWKKYRWLEKIQLIFGLAELSPKLKNSTKIWLITNNFGWAVEPKLKWLPE